MKKLLLLILGFLILGSFCVTEIYCGAYTFKIDPNSDSNFPYCYYNTKQAFDDYLTKLPTDDTARLNYVKDIITNNFKLLTSNQNSDPIDPGSKIYVIFFKKKIGDYKYFSTIKAPDKEKDYAITNKQELDSDDSDALSMPNNNATIKLYNVTTQRDQFGEYLTGNFEIK